MVRLKAIMNAIMEEEIIIIEEEILYDILPILELDLQDLEKTENESY